MNNLYNNDIYTKMAQLDGMFKHPSSPGPVMMDWVSGLEAVKSYPVRFGNSMLLIDAAAKKMYLKTVDQIGTTNCTAYEFTEVKMPSPHDTEKDITNLSERLQRIEQIITQAMTPKEEKIDGPHDATDDAK